MYGVGGSGPVVGAGEGFVVYFCGGVVGLDGGVFVGKVTEVTGFVMGRNISPPGSCGSAWIVKNTLVF